MANQIPTEIDAESEGQRMAREFSQRTNKTLPANAKGSFGIGTSSLGVIPKKDEPDVNEENTDEVDWPKEIDLPQAEPKEEEQEWPKEIDVDRENPQNVKNDNAISANEYYQPNTQDSWLDKKYKAQRELDKKKNELPIKKQDESMGSPIGGPRRVDPVTLKPEQLNGATFKPQANVAKDIAEGAEKNAAKGANAAKSGNLKGAATAAVGGAALKGLQAEVAEKIDNLAESRVIRGFFYQFYFPLFMSSILSLGLMLPVLNFFTFFHKKLSWFVKWGARLAEPAIKDALLATGVGAVATVSIDVIEAATGQDLGSIIGTIFKKAKMPIELKVLTLLLDLAFAIIIGAIVFVALDYTCSGVLGKAGRLVNWTVETVTGDKTLYGGICKFYDDVMNSVNLSGTGSVGSGVGNYGNNGGPINIGKWKDLVNQDATKYNMDPCILNTILEMESGGGNPNAIGHDHHNGGNDPYNPVAPPSYGLNFTLGSHGIGLTQWTIFPYNHAYGKWPNPSIPQRQVYGKWYGVQDFLDPNLSLDLTAHDISDKLKRSGGDLRSAFRSYNGSGSAAEAYADKAMNKYNQCKLLSP